MYSMSRRLRQWGRLCIVSLVLLFSGAPGEGHETSLAATQLPRPEAPLPVVNAAARDTPTRVQRAFSKIPLHFEANRGQTDAQVKFLGRGNGYTVFLKATEAVLTLPQKSQVENQKSSGKSLTSQLQSPLLLRMQLVGANPDPRVAGIEELPGRSNYFVGRDPTQWHADIPTYAKVRYREVYPGIDLVYYGNQEQLEYDFILSPGADPKAIRLAFDTGEGASPLLHVDGEGDLVVSTADSEVRFHQPRIYQEINGVRKTVAGHYLLVDPMTPDSRRRTLDARLPQVGFEVASYDRSKLLVIDPVLSYSTYLGGNVFDGGSGIVVDTAGNAYITGQTNSSDFPITTGVPQTVFADTFVVKLSSTGSLIYSTYFGGNDVVVGQDIAIDSAGDAYIAGYTYSENFPVTTTAFQRKCRLDPDPQAIPPCIEAFVVKLDASGSSLIYATYLGGRGSEAATSIAVDAAGNAYVTVNTSSADFPTTLNTFQLTANCQDNPARPCDLFVVKLNPSGSTVIYSTALGGSDEEFGNAVAVDDDGNAYVTGFTFSRDFPVTHGAFQSTYCLRGNDCSGQAFVVKLNRLGSEALYATYLGGSGEQSGNDIVVDADRNAYVTGHTSSADFPVTQDALQKSCDGDQFGFCNVEVFVTKLNPSGSALIYSTYLGGRDGENFGKSIAVNATGEVYIAGTTNSSDFPTVEAFQTGFGGGQCGPGLRQVPCSDTFVAKLNASGTQLLYSTYLGGNSVDEVEGISLDVLGNVYVTGNTWSRNFPIINAVQPVCGDKGPCTDVFIAKITDQPPGIQAYFESPENGPVAGVAVIRGWAFATQADDHIASVELFIDGQPVDEVLDGALGKIPCCSRRQDVQDAFPQYPAENTLDSGWGVTFNWSLLSAGTHAVRVVIHSASGELFVTDTKTVTVVKPGDFEFLDQFDLSGATARIDGQELAVDGVIVRDKATQQQKRINTSFRWFVSSQSFALTNAETVTTLSSFRSPLSAWFASFASWWPSWPGVANARGTLEAVSYFESPEDGQVVAGVGLIRGWRVAEQTNPLSRASLALMIDGQPAGTIPCCSGRADVAAAFPDNPDALNSGWGAVFNYGTLTPGRHEIEIVQAGPGYSSSLSHMVWVVRPGGFEFIDQVDLSQATAQIVRVHPWSLPEDDEIHLEGVNVRDKATGQTKIISISLRWFQHSQALGVVAASEE